MKKVYLGTEEISDKLRLGSERVELPFTEQLSIEYMAIAGGGGGGGAFNRAAGGGGAGRFVSSSYELPVSGTFAITIGNGGAVDSNGGDTTLIGSGLTIRMQGGGAGGDSQVDGGDGQNGGSGGGGSAEFIGGTYQGGNETNSGVVSDLIGVGFDGQDGGPPGGGQTGAGAGGGPSVQWLDGITYGIGGTAQGTVHTARGSGGRGGDVFTPAATAGIAGLVKIRYQGEVARATGGSITYSNGYVYHTFFSAGTFQRFY